MGAENDGRDDDDQSLYARLRSDLVAHRISAGTILTETSIAAKEGVSRTPAREALTRLEQDRLVDRVPRGYRVRTATAEDIMELYEVRITLESAAAASAALRRTDLDLARLAHLSDALSRAGDTADISSISARWHESLWIAAHNAALSDLLDRVIVQMRLFDDSPVGTSPSVETTIVEHDRILAAIRDNNPHDAHAALVAHLGRTRDLRLAVLAQTHTSSSG